MDFGIFIMVLTWVLVYPRPLLPAPHFKILLGRGGGKLKLLKGGRAPLTV